MTRQTHTPPQYVHPAEKDFTASVGQLGHLLMAPDNRDRFTINTTSKSHQGERVLWPDEGYFQ